MRFERFPSPTPWWGGYRNVGLGPPGGGTKLGDRGVIGRAVDERAASGDAHSAVLGRGGLDDVFGASASGALVDVRVPRPRRGAPAGSPCAVGLRADALVEGVRSACWVAGLLEGDDRGVTVASEFGER